MQIMLDSLTEFHDGGERFILPSNVVRYIEFKNVVVFLLDEHKKRDKIVGVKFSQAGGINHFYIAWEFRIVDGLEKHHKIDGMWLKKMDVQEVVYCYSGGFDIGYYLDPETGKVLHTEPIK